MATKGEATRDRILSRAVALASRDGLGGLSIGVLAGELGLSKSGLFAHFGSKEDLQLEVLRAAVARFEETVMLPAFKAPRGEPRLRAIFEHWLRWGTDTQMPGGCLFLAASAELDDRPGPQRDYLAEAQERLLDSLARVVKLAVDEKQFRADTDPRQFAFEMHAFILGFNHAHRLLDDPSAEKRLRLAFERLLDSARPTRR